VPNFIPIPFEMTEHLALCC